MRKQRLETGRGSAREYEGEEEGRQAGCDVEMERKRDEGGEREETKKMDINYRGGEAKKEEGGQR